MRLIHSTCCQAAKQIYLLVIRQAGIHTNIFRLPCPGMKPRIGLDNFKGVFTRGWFNIETSDRLSFTSAEMDKNYWLTLPRWKSCAIGSHVTSRNQDLSPNDKGRRCR